MRAIVTEEYGSPAVLRELPDREAGQGHILVRIDASSLNGFDIAVAAGMLKGKMAHHFPVVLGRDFAGTVETSNSERFAVGDTVFGSVSGGLGADGGFAELVALPEDRGIAHVPAGLDIISAGALGVAGLAALASVDAIDVTPGDTVLVAGATGGVGSFAVQLLASLGAHVIATARPGAPSDFVRELGAKDVVDYTGDLTEQVRSLAPDGVDAVVHLAGDGVALAELLVDSGRFASTLGLGPDAIHGRGITATSIFEPATEEALDRLAQLVTDGTMRVAITDSSNLEDVPAAIERFSGVLGKSAVSFG